ncbi:hypothetical protein C8Q80DRAFT_1190521 [Daedaleopsis nitida]|nr:hypothetical protein C8Q80DRAFT_1190521 [Daedaleopsis nitida]
MSPASTQELVTRCPLRYVEYPQEPSVPSHLVTGVMLYSGTEGSENIENEKAFPRVVKPFTAPTPPVYKIAPVKGAGLGVVATTDIARGQTIMRERPLLLHPAVIPAKVAGNVDVYEYMVDSMRPENKEAVYALKNAKGPEWHSHTKGIMDTNSFGGFNAPAPGYGSGITYVALGRDISRINHSCVANAMWLWNFDTLTLTVTAHTPIRAGEEVTIGYDEAESPHSRRREVLRRRYKFDCKCPACDQDTMGRLAGDMQRLVVNLFAYNAQPARDAAAFDRWLADGAPVAHGHACPTALLQPLSFARDVERLDGFERARVALAYMLALRYFHPDVWEPVLARIVKGYSVLEDEERVREHALLAAGLRKAYTGSDGGWSEVARRPRDTDWWGKLGEKRVR